MNKAEKSLRWVVNQIPDFKPTTNEEKMLIAIKLYSEAGAEEIKRLESENAALRERLDKAVELKEPYIVEIDHYGGLYIVHYETVRHKCEAYDERTAAKKRLAELKGE